MGLKIIVPKETAKAEKRVAASAETVKKLVAMGALVMLEKGAGEAASISDETFKAAGGLIAKGKDDLYKGANIVLRVQPTGEADLADIPKGALVVGLMAPHKNEKFIAAGKKAGLHLLAMEKVPRISRAQSMDVLSSQSNLAGYKAVLDAAGEYGSAFPMMMTAAGTVPPAKVFVMGAGVAGLQAIATARRLGAVVTATDVRPAAKEQVQSLGASFVAVEDDEFKEAETAGGYAKQMSKEYQKKQAALIEEHIAKQDIVITTALIPGRDAPVLVTAAMVKSMKPGSVIVDLAVEAGGNVQGAKLGSIENVGGVKIMGYENVPSRLASDASLLYAKNVFNLLGLIIDKETRAISKTWMEDEIIQAMLVSEAAAAPKVNAPKKTPTAKPAATKKTAPKKAAPEKVAAKKPTAQKTAKKTASKKD